MKQTRIAQNDSGNITVRDMFFSVAGFSVTQGKKEKLPCGSKNAKFSPQCHTAAIKPASGARPRQ